MVREWLIGGSRYGPDGQNLGPLCSPQTETYTGGFVTEGQSARSLVVEGSLDTGKGSGLPLRLWGCRVRITDESVTSLETVPHPDVVLFDLLLPGWNGLQLARCLRTRAGFRGADLIAVRSGEQEAGLLPSQEPTFDCHLVKTVNRAELRELLAAVENARLVEVP
jgi:CheY-like chemotaxis protein